MKLILAAVALCAAGALAAEQIFFEDTKSCDPECTKYGNCNGETGTCDCPFGLTGSACTQRLFPACHSTRDPGSLPHYGMWYPKNCFCIKQMMDYPYTCPTYLRYEGSTHAYMSPCFYDIVMAHNALCYRYKDRQEGEQLSDSPRLDDPAVEWLHASAYPKWRDQPVATPPEVRTPDSGYWRPLAECPDRCSGRGWCQIKGANQLVNHQHDSDLRWCNCHGFFRGNSCEIADASHCYRNCSGVGTCLGGFCHCQPGYWGHGCTRRKAYRSTVGWRPNHADIKIYVFELPQNLVHRREFNDQWQTIDLMYNSELEFTEDLLGDWAVRTENPWEASLFYVPTFMYWYTGNVGHPYFIVQHVVHHLQRLSPVFNATAGRNFVMWATNDRGTCKLQQAPLEMQHPIKMVHFGQAPRRPYAHRLSLASSSSSAASNNALLGALPQPGIRFEGFPEFNAGDIVEENEICIRPEKDVVAPNYLHEAWVKPENYDRVWKTEFAPDGSRIVTRRPDAPERTATLFFGGYTKPQMVYSQGVRQAIHKMFSPGGKHDPSGPNARPDFHVSMPVYNAIEEMQKAKFCLAPMGAGWGIRLAEAMVTGCVPVIVQDHVYQPLWDVAPFEEFSIRLSRPDVIHLVAHIDGVTPEQLKKLQAGVDKWHRAFFWDVQWGGLAYNFTITALKRRAISMWSANYRHHHHRLRQ